MQQPEALSGGLLHQTRCKSAVKACRLPACLYKCARSAVTFRAPERIIHRAVRLRPSTRRFLPPAHRERRSGERQRSNHATRTDAHPRPRGFRRRLLGDIFHGVKRYLILGVAATLCATFLTYVTPLVVSFTVDSVIGDKAPWSLPAALYRRWSRRLGRARGPSRATSVAAGPRLWWPVTPC